MTVISRTGTSLAVVWATVVSAASGAVTLPVVNASFEDTTGSVSIFNEFSFGGFLGWDVYDNTSGLVGTGASDPF